MVEGPLLTAGVRQIQDIFSTIRTNLSAFLNILGLREKDYFVASLSLALDAMTYTLLYRTIILLFASYDSESSFITLWEEMRPSSFEKSALRKIFWSNRTTYVTVYWRNLRC